jgi:hypothetical protein
MNKENGYYNSKYESLCENHDTQEVYMVMGHGCQFSYYQKVPQDCVYLSLALCGKATSTLSTKKIWTMFEQKQPILAKPCEKFRQLNSILTRTIHNDNYNEDLYPDLIVPDEKYNEDYSTFLTMHYNDPDDQLSMYLDIYYTLLTDTHLTKHNLVRFWKSGLRKMSNKNTNLANGLIMCRKGDYFNDIILHKDDIEFMYEDSIYPTLQDVMGYVHDRKKTYYNSNHGYGNHAPSEKEIDEFYFEQYQSDFEMVKPQTYSRKNYLIGGGLLGDEVLNFDPLISYKDLKSIIERNAITQSELFALYPGIYYNASCRSSGCSNVEKENDRKKLSLEKKKQLFENLYIVEENSRFNKNASQTLRFKNGVDIGDRIDHINMMFKDNELKGSTLFGEAESRGHKTEKKRSIATKVRKLFSTAKAKGAARKTKKIIGKRRIRRR